MAVILFISTLFTYWCISNGQSACVTPSGGVGECVNLFNCMHILTMAADSKEASQVIKHICGPQSNGIPTVCCPSNATNICTTPKGDPGICTKVHACPTLLSMLRVQPMLPETVTFLRNSRCESPEPYSVCCPTFNRESTDGGRSRCAANASPPDPDTNCCGLDSGVYKTIPGNVTEIGQYSWSTLLEHEENGETTIRCGGVLISGRYVLTASHCVFNLDRKLVKVRLGEFDISNPGKDCVMEDGLYCTDEPRVVPVEKIIMHPEYDPWTRKNDIALVRFAELVTFTDYIRPICLPASDFTAATSIKRLRLYNAGWGFVGGQSLSRKRKLHAHLFYIPQPECQNAVSYPLPDGVICAGGAQNNDVCKSDPGGPLFRRTFQGSMELVGIASFWPRQCYSNKPGGYTNVYQYLPWIRSQIED